MITIIINIAFIAIAISSYHSPSLSLSLILSLCTINNHYSRELFVFSLSYSSPLPDSSPMIYAPSPYMP